MISVEPIRPELLAAKLEKIGNFEHPRLLEEFIARPELRPLLCHLQYVSQPHNYAGGLGKFAANLIESSTDLIGTAHMQKTPAADRYTLRDAVTIFRELTSDARYDVFGCNCELFEEAFLYGQHEKAIPLGESRRDWVPQFLDGLTPARALQICTEEAQSRLAEYLKGVCELPHVGLLPATREEHGAPWYFVHVANALAAFINQSAEEQRAKLGQTAITRLIDTWIARSRHMGTTVMVIGNSRVGKSECIECEAAAMPGYCRLIQTPPGNSLSELLREVAKSLGVDVGPQTNARSLAEKIDYVLRFLKVQLIFDEAAWLLPSVYSRHTAPARLNWFRHTIMDRQIAAVLVSTPQSYFPAKRRFLKATGYAIEQFDERIDETVNLPTELQEEDLLAVARVHFADLSEDSLDYVVARTVITDRNFISDIAKVARHAKYNAKENGRSRPILADIKAAIAGLLHSAERPVEKQASRKVTAAPLQVRSTASAKTPPGSSRIAPVETFSRRGLEPVEMKL